ncbi:MAG: YfaZ family outer membrane protein [Woeseiaceae bacterium]|nr:YfaZ family outer membrane protein [Woeseiaceae bacterium]
MRLKQLLLAVCLCLSAAPAFAQTTGTALDVNLNNDAIRLGFSWRLGDPRYLAGLGWLYNEERGDVIHGSFHLVDAASSSGSALQAGLGVRLVHTRTDPSTFDGTALALGGFARYTLPNANRYNVSGYAYYAPDITSFGDQSEYYELGARVGYSVLRDGDVYLGVRRIQAKYDGTGRITFDSGLHAGFEIRFQ